MLYFITKNLEKITFNVDMSRFVFEIILELQTTIHDMRKNIRKEKNI